MSRATPVRLNLVQLRKQAKAILRAHRAGDPDVSPVLRRLPRFAAAGAPDILAAEVTLADVQFALAREHGFENWADLKRHVESQAPRPRGELRREGSAAWVTQVPGVGWGLNRDCTFIGCLEAALAPTDEAWSYAELMAFSGLAFRIRWSADFCPSCAVGEMPDESNAIGRCTGLALPTDVQFGQDSPDRESIRRKIVESIDAGRPLLAYGICLDVSVVYGYEDDGRLLWLTDYHAKGDMPCRLPLEKLGPLQTYPLATLEAPSPREQLRLALEQAVTNWHRREHDGGIRGRRYLYGRAAYDAWREAVAQADHLAHPQLAQLHHTRKFVWATLADARQAAARFLSDCAQFAPAGATSALREAVGHSAAQSKRLHDAFNRHKLFAGPLDEWTADRRAGEMETIEGMKHQDELLHAALQKVLSAVGA